MIFDALLNVAYRVSLDGPGAELEEGVQTPPTRRGLICKLAICILYVGGGIEGLYHILLLKILKLSKIFLFF